MAGAARAAVDFVSAFTTKNACTEPSSDVIFDRLLVIAQLIALCALVACGTWLRRARPTVEKANILFAHVKEQLRGVDVSIKVLMHMQFRTCFEVHLEKDAVKSHTTLRIVDSGGALAELLGYRVDGRPFEALFGKFGVDLGKSLTMTPSSVIPVVAKTASGEYISMEIMTVPLAQVESRRFYAGIRFPEPALPKPASALAAGVGETHLRTPNSQTPELKPAPAGAGHDADLASEMQMAVAKFLEADPGELDKGPSECAGPDSSGDNDSTYEDGYEDGNEDPVLHDRRGCGSGDYSEPDDVLVLVRGPFEPQRFPAEAPETEEMAEQMGSVRLSELLALKSARLPSLGSASHGFMCRPCIFENRRQHISGPKCWKGCLCEFCHCEHACVPNRKEQRTQGKKMKLLSKTGEAMIYRGPKPAGFRVHGYFQ